MDVFDDDGGDPVISDRPIPIPRAPRGSKWSGWLIGAVCGVVASLLAFPAVRYTLSAQIEFALSAENVPWIFSLDAQRTQRESPRLDHIAARYPGDYLLQVGRATALATSGGVSRSSPVRRADPVEQSDHTLARLGGVTRAFSTTPGAYAHLARYLMLGRVRIERPELGAKRPDPNRDLRPEWMRSRTQRSLEIMIWALKSGERLDRENAFWPAMLAATYFAGNRDDEALEALARASKRRRWDAYIYEEVLGQWRLFSAAYGDHGAMQQIGPLSLVVFPHLYEIRRMGEMARWHAEALASAGKPKDAARIRRNLARLGINLRDNAGWAFEALYGTDIFLIACTDQDARVTPGSIKKPADWEPQAVRYHRLLQSIHRDYEYRLIRSEVENSCSLRKRVDLARYDASYPGIPPGIPLLPLFGNWMGAVCLVQQALGLLLATAVALIWQRLRSPNRSPNAFWRSATVVLVAVATFGGSAVFFTGSTSPRLAGFVLAGYGVLALVGLERFWVVLPEVRSRIGMLLRGGAPTVSTGSEPAMSLSSAESRWTHGTTLRMLLLTVPPYLWVLVDHRTELSGLHPVAILLTSLTGVPRALQFQDAIELALLSGALPIILPLACGLWGLYRGESPIDSAITGVKRLLLPSLICLVVTYAVLLNRTLILDAQASQAIQKAAQNDRQWVLTHGAEDPF